MRDVAAAGDQQEQSVGWRALVQWLAPARYERLEAAIAVARREIDGREEPVSVVAFAPSVDVAAIAVGSWKVTALSLLTEAECALAAGKVNEAWTMLHAARRLEISGLRDSELPSFAAALRAEAQKLKPWRQKAVASIVGTADKPRDASRSDLVQAAIVRDDHYDNQGYKDQLMRTQVLALALLLAVELAAIVALSWKNLLASGEKPALLTLVWLVSVMLFGNLGATVSAMLRTVDATNTDARIPELTAANRVTFLRIAMGGASAILIDLVVRSNVPGVFNPTLKDFIKNINAEGAYVIAFVAGFTERLVLRAVETVAGKASGSDAKPAAANERPAGQPAAH